MPAASCRAPKTAAERPGSQPWAGMATANGHFNEHRAAKG